jgi:hypothetical protein
MTAPDYLDAEVAIVRGQITELQTQKAALETRLSQLLARRNARDTPLLQLPPEVLVHVVDMLA